MWTLFAIAAGLTSADRPAKAKSLRAAPRD
jgi:hypothetical protein